MFLFFPQIIVIEIIIKLYKPNYYKLLLLLNVPIFLLHYKSQYINLTLLVLLILLYIFTHTTSKEYMRLNTTFFLSQK